jgi:hypothetical protein
VHPVWPQQGYRLPGHYRHGKQLPRTHPGHTDRNREPQGAGWF